jgi:hypothetical protein
MSRCVACEGTGKASKGGPCVPCHGQGKTGNGLVQHSSATPEHYTPNEIVTLSRIVLGGIDLDPASCPLAQEVVRASTWYGPGSPHGEDGLAQAWQGRVFLNPPGGRVPELYQGLGTNSNAAFWWGVLASQYPTRVTSAIFVGFTLEILRSAQALDVPQPLDFPLCVPRRRIAFDTERAGVRVPSSSPTHANVIVFLPPVVGRAQAVAAFASAFGQLGRCRP